MMQALYSTSQKIQTLLFCNNETKIPLLVILLVQIESLKTTNLLSVSLTLLGFAVFLPGSLSLGLPCQRLSQVIDASRCVLTAAMNPNLQTISHRLD